MHCFIHWKIIIKEGEITGIHSFLPEELRTELSNSQVLISARIQASVGSSTPSVP